MFRADDVVCYSPEHWAYLEQIGRVGRFSSRQAIRGRVLADEFDDGETVRVLWDADHAIRRHFADNLSPYKGGHHA